LVLGCFKLKFIRVSHSIPDSVMVVMDTPVGKIVHTGDYKFDLTPVDFNPTELHKIAALYSENVLALFADSTNADQPGHQLSELEIKKTLETIFKQAPGRIIIGTFASLLSRIQHILSIAEELDKKVIIDGRSMKANVQIAHELGYLKYKSSTLIEYPQMKDYPDNRIIVACTGAQGEDNAVLMRIANNEHKMIKIIPGDTVIFSSSVIPGNERSVQKLRDNLYLHHANVINYHMMDVHAGGHAKQEDIKLLIKLVNPKYYIPIYGTRTHIYMNAEVAKTIGIPKENILITSNGQIMEFGKDRNGILTNNKLQMNDILVDGLGIGDVSGIVIRDRKQMSEHGMVVVIATVNGKTGELISSPDIISRGFIYMNANKGLVEEIRSKVKECLKDTDPLSPANQVYLKEKIRNDIGKFIYRKTHRTPMILPVILTM
ncbi:ribonuclease J, partial [Patescibacteria group bacterium]|nr:ribonuclease J [Patescibacteria group bacterium]